VNSSGGFRFGKSCFNLMPGTPRLSAICVLVMADAFLIIQAMGRNILAEVVLGMVTIPVCDGECQVVLV